MAVFVLNILIGLATLVFSIRIVTLPVYLLAGLGLYLAVSAIHAVLTRRA